MPSRIKILPEDLTNKIAAGEVVERPASVVKELLENAIDANASQVKVEIQSAGRKLIRVSDNGQGMTREEVKLAIERHSTSKISQLDDLFNIQTLGFRGEALPSIASVSIMEISSKVKGEEAGSLLRVEGEKIGTVEEAGSPVGTTIVVKDIFFNTPARKKFLKSPPTEMGHIGDIVAKYALANPRIAFELVSDGKPLLVTSGSGNLKDAVVSIYSLELAKELVEVQLDFKLGKIRGLISRPTLSRLDKSYETFFVNGRYVRNFLLNRALEEGYRTLIPNNRYPVAIVFVDIDPKQVDVNVHPTKREIKFVKTQEVMNAITLSVKESLSGFTEYQNFGGSEPEPQNTRRSDKEWQPAMADALFPSPVSELRTLNSELEIEVSAVQPLFPIYQYKATYIICTDGEDLALIDQHAAHERIIYDQLGHKSKTQGQQPLLVPETIETGPKEAAVLGENIEYLKSLGFDLEEFGNNTYILRSVPALATKSPAKQMLLDIVSELQTLGKSAQLEIKQENIRKLIACHSAIKAGDKLSAQEMNQLIKDLFATENPATCPHGRPTIIRLSQEELNKRFGR